MKHVSNFSVLFALAFLACACSSSKPDAEPDPNIVPANYKDEIIAAVRRTNDDPVGIREAFIAVPALKPSGMETRYISCVRYNAKNNDGIYSGSKEMAAVFYAGKLTTMIRATKEQCGGAPYQPFPELEKLCREAVCPAR